jgi:sterol desaturase/sphingolipid hydroxylase (fatty acid hydroxylase superfamily)
VPEKLFTRYQDFEIAALLGLAVVFALLEHLRPARPLDRRRFLRLDLLGLLVAVVSVNVSRLSLFFLLDSLGARDRLAVPAIQSLPSVVKIAGGIVVLDFCLYWIHRAMHRFDVLWRAHEWHHSIEQLYWFSGLRASFVHIFLYAVPQVVVPFFVLQATPLEAGIGFALGVFVQFYVHSNTDLGLGPLDWLVISPRYHRVHHSLTKNRDMNLGTTLTLWDRIFGTYVDPASVAPGYVLGLGYPKSPARMMLGV